MMATDAAAISIVLLRRAVQRKLQSHSEQEPERGDLCPNDELCPSAEGQVSVSTSSLMFAYQSGLILWWTAADAT